MKYILILLASVFYFNCFTQCTTPTGLFTTNITSYNALANWSSVAGADHYKIRYREYNSSSWNNLGNILSNDSTRNIPLLQQNTCYEWEIMSFCDSTNLLGSSWSIKDTFTTTAFIPATFDPSINYDLSDLECNKACELIINTSQLNDEPDIATLKIHSDYGRFEMANLLIGDSVGYSVLNLNTQTINATLRYGGEISVGVYQINAFNSFGLVIGTFNIENKASGVSVLSISPNDGNNYTSGYTSRIHITNLFINPPNAGPLNFYAEINSELNHQTQDSSSVLIWCTTNIKNHNASIFNPLRYDILGRHNKKPMFYKNSRGGTVKKILAE